uniref:VWFA domain-containing protein n=1 Tax=Panagrellus redivivus TaxID=6233 RepID=A0A7E4VSE4_PANRE
MARSYKYNTVIWLAAILTITTGKNIHDNSKLVDGSENSAVVVVDKSVHTVASDIRETFIETLSLSGPNGFVFERWNIDAVNNTCGVQDARHRDSSSTDVHNSPRTLCNILETASKCGAKQDKLKDVIVILGNYDQIGSCNLNQTLNRHKWHLTVFWMRPFQQTPELGLPNVDILDIGLEVSPKPGWAPNKALIMSLIDSQNKYARSLGAFYARMAGREDLLPTTTTTTTTSTTTTTAIPSTTPKKLDPEPVYLLPKDLPDAEAQINQKLTSTTDILTTTLPTSKLPEIVEQAEVMKNEPMLAQPVILYGLEDMNETVQSSTIVPDSFTSTSSPPPAPLLAKAETTTNGTAVGAMSTTKSGFYKCLEAVFTFGHRIEEEYAGCIWTGIIVLIILLICLSIYWCMYKRPSRRGRYDVIEVENGYTNEKTRNRTEDIIPTTSTEDYRTVVYGPVPCPPEARRNRNSMQGNKDGYTPVQTSQTSLTPEVLSVSAVHEPMTFTTFRDDCITSLSRSSASAIQTPISKKQHFNQGADIVPNVIEIQPGEDDDVSEVEVIDRHGRY